jgi:hypothetical protein
VNDEEFNEKNYTKYVAELKAQTNLVNAEKKAENSIYKNNLRKLNYGVSHESLAKAIPNSNRNTTNFFQQSFKGYLNGELTCAFCEAKALPWPIANQHCENQQVSKLIELKEISSFFVSSF